MTDNELKVYECNTEISLVQAATLFKSCHENRTLKRAWQLSFNKSNTAKYKKGFIYFIRIDCSRKALS